MATYIRLTTFNDSGEKETQYHNKRNHYVLENQSSFSKIPGSPIAYWGSKKIIKLLLNDNIIYDIFNVTGSFNKTGCNEKYVRFFWEINNNLLFDIWRVYIKGGNYRKWYGNNENVVDWSEKAKEYYRNNKTSNLINYEFTAMGGITYTDITNTGFYCRLLEQSHIVDMSGPSLFTSNMEDVCYYLAFYNSVITPYIIEFLNPTNHVKIYDIIRIPLIFDSEVKINNIVQNSISISKEEWNSRETSWDFTKNELLKHKPSSFIKDAVAAYCEHWTTLFNTLHENEVELNRIFLKIYDLEDELEPDVALEDVTILRDEAPDRNGGLHFKEEVLVKQFLSYAVGCFFGRYNPHNDGLVLANTGDSIEAYRERVGRVPSYLLTDNVLPLTDGPYFAQDILALLKVFLADTFGEESVSENIDYLAGVLSPRSRASSEDVIRYYFIKDFYRDHKRMYQNRPIYWLCTSGEDGAFSALFYLHRYEPSLPALVRQDYALRLQARYQAFNSSLEGEDLSVQRKREDLQRRIRALQAYDVHLKDMADRYIPLDLDDGVKVNIAKFEGIIEGV